MKCYKCKNEAVMGKALCAECNAKARAYQTEWRKKNKEAVLQHGATYRACHAVKEQIRHKKHYDENKVGILEKNRANYLATRESRLIKTRDYYNKNKEWYSEYHRVWYVDNKSHHLRVVKKYRTENPDKCYSFKAIRRAREKNAFVETVNRKEIFERDGYICQLCGTGVVPWMNYGHPLYPTIDHIIPLSRGGTHEPSNVQTAHRGCNASKHARPDVSTRYIKRHILGDTP